MNDFETLLTKYARPKSPASQASLLHQIKRKGAVDTVVGRIPAANLGFSTPLEALKMYARCGHPEDVAAVTRGTQTPVNESMSAMSRALWKAGVLHLVEGVLNYQQSGDTFGHIGQAVKSIRDWVDLQRIRVQTPERKRKFTGTVRELTLADLQQSHIVEEILSHWVVDPSTNHTSAKEVAQFLLAMTESVMRKNDRRYFVAETTWGQIAGIIGIKSISDNLKPFAKTKYPGETVNVYSDPYFHKQGVGRQLLAHVEKVLLEMGYSEAILISSPRFKDSWQVYEHLGFRLYAIDDAIYNNQTGSHIYGKVLKN